MSFLSSWFTAPAPPLQPSDSEQLASITITVPEDDEQDDNDDDDSPPSFPMPGSIQRATPGPSSSLALPPSTTKVPAKPRKKVALAPGHSSLDWARLASSGVDLRGTPTLLRVNASMLKEHRSKDDAWTAINGKVYNITPYLDYHPGGVPELMRVAGRDGTKLFGLTHAWVSVDMMLAECMVGFFVDE